jgi:hypothetical protein
MSSETVAVNMKAKRTTKRCPNGFRKDKNTNTCVQYANVKTFSDLRQQDISETKNTVTIEGLGEKNKDGAIIKVYQEGDLHSQHYVSPEKVKKVQERTKEQSKKVLEVMKKIGKSPEMMMKDKKFRQFQKKLEESSKKLHGKNKTIKGGRNMKAAEIIPNYTNYYIDSNIIPNADVESKGLIETHFPYQQWWRSICGLNFMNGIIDLSFATNVSAKFAAGLGLDFIGSIFLSLLDILPMIFPTVKEVDSIVTIAQYVFYAAIIPANIWLLGGWWWVASIIPTINLFMIQHNKPPADMLMTKRDLYHMENRLYVGSMIVDMNAANQLL